MLAGLKTVGIKLNGHGYVLQIGETRHRLHPREALDLLTSLLHTLPEVPDGVTLAHQIRNGPRLTIYKIWRPEDNKIICDRYQAQIVVQGKTVYRSEVCDSFEAARDLASYHYGQSFPAFETEEMPGSQILAKKKASEWIINDYVTRNKTSISDLFVKIKSSGVPEDLDLTVEVVR